MVWLSVLIPLRHRRNCWFGPTALWHYHVGSAEYLVRFYGTVWFSRLAVLSARCGLVVGHYHLSQDNRWLLEEVTVVLVLGGWHGACLETRKWFRPKRGSWKRLRPRTGTVLAVATPLCSSTDPYCVYHCLALGGASRLLVDLEEA